MKLMKYLFNKEKSPSGNKQKAADPNVSNQAILDMADPLPAAPPISNTESKFSNGQVLENAPSLIVPQKLEAETSDTEVNGTMEIPQDNDAKPAKKSDTPAVPTPKNEGLEPKEKGMFSSLFAEVEEKEETPIDRLIKVLPDVSTHELLDELQEVNMIIKDWRQL